MFSGVVRLMLSGQLAPELNDSGQPMEKMSIARRQLGMASYIFIEDLDPVSVHTLVCAAREILERICHQRSQLSLLGQLAVNAGRPIGDLRALANQYARALKHNKPDQDDAPLLERFCDQQNDFLLFIAWSDYRTLTGAMPVEAQVIYSWVEALYPEKMETPRDFSGRPALMDLPSFDRKIQKLRLKECVVAARQWKWLNDHDETERSDLVYRSEADYSAACLSA